MTITNIKAFIGAPGTGKTHQLVRMVNDLINKDESVYIMNPTKSARNNVRKAFTEMLDNNDMSFDNYEEAIKSTNVLHGYDENLAQNIFIDESAMVDLSVFYSLLYMAQDIHDVHLYLFGDLKQIEPVNGDSILKTLIENTMDKDETRNIWEYVADTLYSDMNDMTVESPSSWKLDSNVNIEVFKKNYRLESKNFSGYNNDYYDDLIEHTIFEEDYSGYLKYAIENYYLITTPTHYRGKEINDSLKHQYDDFESVAPFVIVNKDYFLNPFNNNFDELKQAFDFLSVADIEVAQSGDFTAYMSTHKVQSFTVDNVLFYMGNNPIGNRHKSHYSNNLLYTAISRAKYNVQILGLPESFKEMRTIMPQTAQEKNVHLKASVAISNLSKWVESNNNTPTADEIYDKYIEMYKDESLIPKHEESILKIYNIESEPYRKRYVINFINNKYTDKFGFTLAQWLKDNSSKSKANNTNAKGKGKVQLWIDGLSNEQLEEVKQDLNDLSIRKFKDKYGYNKRYIKF